MIHRAEIRSWYSRYPRIQCQSGQALLPSLTLRQKGLVPAATALRACVTSTPSSSARQTLPSIAFGEFTGSAGDVTARSIGGRTLLNHKAYQAKVKTPSQAVSRDTLSKVSRAYKGSPFRVRSCWTNKKMSCKSTTYKTFQVPRAGVEPARVTPLVFETSASTDSAIWACYEKKSLPAGTLSQPPFQDSGQSRSFRLRRQRYHFFFVYTTGQSQNPYQKRR